MQKTNYIIEDRHCHVLYYFCCEGGSVEFCGQKGKLVETYTKVP
ncbi:protein of unknown function [Maridesulfovibrio hydrothermalis AM13 = DSM 14728]|uniref:Uncharacterized protein n=1 Tax=Maridesulfovibrio hydrothermalis AM13 = DSM 14728 TaxID=1121451 RepID=L0R9Y8_9BACT|nr:protein of unknown function [Maridesulfovibrio hydrothermalis AM13 = DSM 14728]